MGDKPINNKKSLNVVKIRDRNVMVSPSGREEIQNDKFGTNNNPSAVLLITITNVKYPVNAEVLFSVFNKFGDVLKAIVFEK